MSQLRTKGDPIAVHRTVVDRALELLGITGDVAWVTIERDRIWVARRWVDDANKLVARTTTTVIDIRDEEQL